MSPNYNTKHDDINHSHKNSLMSRCQCLQRDLPVTQHVPPPHPKQPTLETTFSTSRCLQAPGAACAGILTQAADVRTRPDFQGSAPLKFIKVKCKASAQVQRADNRKTNVKVISATITGSALCLPGQTHPDASVLHFSRETTASRSRTIHVPVSRVLIMEVVKPIPLPVYLPVTVPRGFLGGSASIRWPGAQCVAQRGPRSRPLWYARTAARASAPGGATHSAAGAGTHLPGSSARSDAPARATPTGV